MPSPHPNTSRPQRLHKISNSRSQRHNATSVASTNTSNGRAEDTVPQLSEHQCCGVVEEAAFQVREKRDNRTVPQPWIVRKLMILVTLGLMGYTAYVYIGRFCLNVIKRAPGATAGRATGIALLTIFCVLYLWMVLAYLKVIVTPPGYARDYIPRTARPFFDLDTRRSIDRDTEPTLTQYPPDLENQKVRSEFDRAGNHRYNKPSYSSSHTRAPSQTTRPQPADPLGGPSYEEIIRQSNSQDQSLRFERSGRGDEEEGSERAIPVSSVSEDDGGVGQGRLRTPFDPPFSIYLPEEESIPEQREVVPEPGRSQEMGPMGREVHADLPRPTSFDVSPPSKAQVKAPSDRWKMLLLPCAVCCGGSSSSQSKSTRRSSHKKQGLPARRRPSTTPVLHPTYRYCDRDGIVKPYRAHHCRNCGTCVLKFDHHCPWIGQCVGARNHKFFMNFCQSASVLTLYVLGTLLGFNVPAWVSSSSTATLDPQVVVVSALAALFGLFTSVLAFSHMLLILKGQTTVENMMIQSAKEREFKALTKEFGWFAFGAKRDAKKQWREEWGDLDTEGNMWWTGSKRQGWIDVMGTNPLGWIFPIGRSIGDGLLYPVNPRFDEYGRLKRRAQWPAELR